MSTYASLSELEQLLILAVARTEAAYGVPLRREIEERSGRSASMAAVYAGLDRLERRRLLTHEMSAPTPERGGRRRKLYRVTPAGAEAVTDARRAMDRMWDGIDLTAEKSA